MGIKKKEEWEVQQSGHAVMSGQQIMLFGILSC
jgi:hypothetical protein